MEHKNNPDKNIVEPIWVNGKYVDINTGKPIELPEENQCEHCPKLETCDDDICP